MDEGCSIPTGLADRVAAAAAPYCRSGMRMGISAVCALLLAGCEGEAEKAVRYRMLDPDAAKFREVGSCGGDRTVVRGEANGKNSFGAYTGFKLFFYSDGVVAYAGDDEFMPLMERCYGDLEDLPTDPMK